MTKFLGVDLHSTSMSCCRLSEQKNMKDQFKFPVNKKGIESFLKQVDKDTYVILEASTNSFLFVRTISAYVKNVILACPFKLRLIFDTKKKTDKIDAQKLATYLKMQVMSDEKLIEPVWVPDETTQELRSLFTSYKLLRKKTTSVKNRICSILRQNIIQDEETTSYFTKAGIERLRNEQRLSPANKLQLDIHIDTLLDLMRSVKRIKKLIIEVGLSKFRREVEILISISGVSVVLAIAVMSDIGDVKRFKNSKSFTAYLRSAPGVDASNETIKNLSTNKFGRKMSITFLSQSVNHILNNNEKLGRWYKKLCQYKRPGSVRMAVCRRTFTEMYQMLKKNEISYYCNKVQYEMKIKDINRFLEGKSEKLLKLA